MDNKKQYIESLKVDLDRIPVKRLTEREKRRTYEQFVSGQENQFILFINYLNKYINELRNDGIISPFLEFRARIKATNSALKNNERKALDDIFGIEFVCATDGEIEILLEEVKRLLLVSIPPKVHDKDNGYKAIHHLCSIKEETIEKLNEIARKQGKDGWKNETFPAIEVQYKTIEVDYQATYGTASHERYKDVRVGQLQKLYDSNILTVGEYIPYMWISDPNGDSVRELSTEEVLKKMYPSLVLKKEKEREEK